MKTKQKNSIFFVFNKQKKYIASLKNAENTKFRLDNII